MLEAFVRNANINRYRRLLAPGRLSGDQAAIVANLLAAELRQEDGSIFGPLRIDDAPMNTQ